jgi:hypothetical protein
VGFLCYFIALSDSPHLAVNHSRLIFFFLQVV